MLALMGSEIRASASKSTVKANRTPLRSGERDPRRGERRASPSRDVTRTGLVDFAALRGMDDRQVGRRVDGKSVEDGPERPVQPVEGGRPQALLPAVIDDGREGRPDLPRPKTGSSGAHGGVVLGRLPQWLALRWRERDVPPPVETVEEESVRARPGAECRHRDVVGIEVLQHVGPQRERDQPGSAAPGIRTFVAGGAMRQAVLRLVVELDRVRDQGL